MKVRVVLFNVLEAGICQTSRYQINSQLLFMIIVYKSQMVCFALRGGGGGGGGGHAFIYKPRLSVKQIDNETME